MIIRVSNVPSILIFTCLYGWLGSSLSAAHAGTERMLVVAGHATHEQQLLDFQRIFAFLEHIFTKRSRYPLHGPFSLLSNFYL